MSTSTSTAGQITRSTNNNKRKRLMTRFEVEDLFDEVVAHCYHGIEPYLTFSPVEGEARKKYGDYAFFGVQDICNRLRENDPRLFYHYGPIDIAEKIKRVFEAQRFPMIRRLVRRKTGILTFSLEGSWIAERINTMLIKGINTWAPTLFKKAVTVVFNFPAFLYNDADYDVPAIYTKDALANMYLYSGADVGSGLYNDEALRKVEEHFTRKEGKIVSKKHLTCLTEPSVPYIYTLLATLWYGANIQKAHVLVYLTPHQLRGYMEQCRNAAAKEGWIQDSTLICSKYRIYSGKHDLPSFWHMLNSADGVAYKRLLKLSTDAGYTPRAFFECAFKFTCLKSHRLAEPIFTFQDFADEEGNTLASLLKTKALLRSLMRNSRGRSSLMLNVLTGKERELGLQFVQFTEVIHTASRAFGPHHLCKYLCGLSKLFTCCYHQVWQDLPSENMLGLCEATRVVMNKCFELLGIAPSSTEWSKEFESFYSKGASATQLRIIPEDARSELYPYSRFEIFSMNVGFRVGSEIATPNEGYVTGRVAVVDKCLSNSDGWAGLGAIDCYVLYFDRKWYNEVAIKNGSYISLGNTSSAHSVPFSSSIEVDLMITATSKERDQSYSIYNGKGRADLTKFWDGDLNTMCGTIKRESEDGRILLDFVAIKDAVDTTMELTFNPVKAVRLRGSITASYENDILGNRNFLGQYTAQIFKADSTTTFIRCEKPYSLPLYKSAMDVPVNGCLRMHARLVDADTGRRIVDEEMKLSESESCDGISRWTFRCDKGSFEFTLKWIHQARRG